MELIRLDTDTEHVPTRSTPTSVTNNTLQQRSLFLYKELAARLDAIGIAIPNAKSYFAFKPQMLRAPAACRRCNP